MHRFQRFISKLGWNFQVGGLKGGLQFIAWLSRLWLEKLAARLDSACRFWQVRHACKSLVAGRACPAGTAAGKVIFVIPARQVDRALALSLRSLQAQRNAAWECLLCVRPGIPVDGLDRELARDDRINRLDWPAAENADQLMIRIAALTTGDWLVLTWPGTRHHPDLVDCLLSQEADIVYWDEDVATGLLHHLPFLKPEWSPELWLSVDLLRSAAYRISLLARLRRAGADAMLQVEGVRQAKRIQHLPRVLSHHRRPAWEDAGTLERHASAVARSLELQGLGSGSGQFDRDGRFRLAGSPSKELVSIIIPSKDQVECLSRCLDTIERTAGEVRFEIVIVDNESTGTETLAYYRSLKEARKNLRVVRYGPGFNFSRACNQGAKAARGRFLLFLNNDVEGLEPGWIDRLVAATSLEGVGVAGARLLYPDGRIQHAGIVVGLGGHASHVWRGSRKGGLTPFGRADWYRNYSAVTGACLMTRREVFQKLQGFDEGFELVFGDVDYCLRAGEHGYRTVFDPDVTMIHHEGLSRGRTNPGGDIRLAAMRFQRYLAQGDPCYSPGLSNAGNLPTLKLGWEQKPAERVERIIRYEWY